MGVALYIMAPITIEQTVVARLSRPIRLINIGRRFLSFVEENAFESRYCGSPVRSVTNILELRSILHAKVVTEFLDFVNL